MNIGQSFSTAWTYEGKKTICKITYLLQIPKENSEEVYIRQFSARGISVCSPADTYDKEFGKTLASARARQKIEKKLEKELIRYSYQNSIQHLKFIDDGAGRWGFNTSAGIQLFDNSLLEIGGKLYRVKEVKKQ